MKGRHFYADQRGTPGGGERAGTVGHVSLDLRDLGSHLLRNVVSDTRVACFHYR